jgi:hypothetical protein
MNRPTTTPTTPTTTSTAAAATVTAACKFMMQKDVLTIPGPLFIKIRREPAPALSLVHNVNIEKKEQRRKDENIL